jgi:hypothetical protein
MTGASGTEPYSYDRIRRGHTYIQRVCISLFGTTQPGRISEYVRRVVRGGRGDDGMLQRFSVIVWPDQNGEWCDHDEYPNNAAKSAVWDIARRLSSLTPADVDAEVGQFGGSPFLRFEPTAHGLFVEWRTELENKMIREAGSPALEGHFSKYRKLTPGLALIFHLVDGGTGPVGPVPLVQALGFTEYLASHARRLYGAVTSGEVAAAHAILRHIRKGDLEDGFTARMVYRKQWSGLPDEEIVRQGLELLVDYRWLKPEDIKTAGRTTTRYWINPRGLT